MPSARVAAASAGTTAASRRPRRRTIGGSAVPARSTPRRLLRGRAIARSGITRTALISRARSGVGAGRRTRLAETSPAAAGRGLRARVLVSRAGIPATRTGGGSGALSRRFAKPPPPSAARLRRSCRACCCCRLLISRSGRRRIGSHRARLPKRPLLLREADARGGCRLLMRKESRIARAARHERGRAIGELQMRRRRRDRHLSTDQPSRSHLVGRNPRHGAEVAAPEVVHAHAHDAVKPRVSITVIYIYVGKSKAFVEATAVESGPPPGVEDLVRRQRHPTDVAKSKSDADAGTVAEKRNQRR